MAGASATEPTRRGGVHVGGVLLVAVSFEALFGRARCGGCAFATRGLQLDTRDPVLCARGRRGIPALGDGAASGAAAATVAVRTVAVPAAVDRPQFVVRAGDARVNLDEFNRWAGPLRDEIARVVAGNLAAELGAPVITVSSALPAASDLIVLLDVQRFDAKTGEGVEVDIVWIVRRALDDTPGRSGRSAVREPISGEGYGRSSAQQPCVGKREPRHCRGDPRTWTSLRVWA
jgi:uncharacterized lipoprotein YmbA